MTTDHLKFSPEILRRLGEELIPHVDQGITELVRNSYDADAINCQVELVQTEEPGGTVRLVDDGIGMALDDIRSGWLVLGRSAKAERKLTGLRRIPVGDKGLGRLAALRMGAIVELTTRPKKEPNCEYRLAIDWAHFDAAELVEDVPLQISETKTDKTQGTIIEIKDLRMGLDRAEVQRLARALLLLADPFDDKTGFHPKLLAPAFTDLEKRVREAYFDEAEFKLVAELDQDGLAKVSVLDWKGRELWTARHEDLSRTPYNTASARFELWVFILDRNTFSTRTATIGEVREWLSLIGGVHLYHRGLRVHPYGDSGHDWLEMNLARVRDPEFRPGTNTSIGRIMVADPQERLIQKIDRTGFIENEAFNELKRFAVDALNWMAKQRLRAREQKRQEDRIQTPRDSTKAKKDLRQAIEQIPPKARPAVEQAIQKFERAKEREVRTLREEVQLYRTLATVGTTIAVFAHESAKPVTQIERLAKSIETRGRRILDGKYSEVLEEPVQLVVKSAQALRSFANLPLSFLKKDKRRIGQVDVHEVISEIRSLFNPFFDDAKVATRCELVKAAPVLRGSVAALEAVIANLLVNSINAFNSPDAKSDTRQIIIRTEISGDYLLLRILDSGPGIKGLGLEDIWLPGQTTTPGGTGLGLTIVRDSVTDLGGKVQALANGELGGAEFAIELPMIGGNK